MVKEIPGLFAGTRYSGEGQHRTRKRGAFHRRVPWLPGRRQLPLPPARPGAAVSPEPPQLPAATPLPCSQLWHQPGVPRRVPAAREGSHHRPASRSFLSGYLAWTNALGRKAGAVPAACCRAGCKQLAGLARGASSQGSPLLPDPTAGGSCKALGMLLVQQKATAADVSAGPARHLGGFGV